MARVKGNAKQPSRKCNRREQKTNLTVSFLQSVSVLDESLVCADVAIKVRAHSTRCVFGAYHRITQVVLTKVQAKLDDTVTLSVEHHSVQLCRRMR